MFGALIPAPCSGYGSKRKATLITTHPNPATYQPQYLKSPDSVTEPWGMIYTEKLQREGKYMSFVLITNADSPNPSIHFFLTHSTALPFHIITCRVYIYPSVMQESYHFPTCLGTASRHSVASTTCVEMAHTAYQLCRSCQGMAHDQGSGILFIPIGRLPQVHRYHSELPSKWAEIWAVTLQGGIFILSGRLPTIFILMEAMSAVLNSSSLLLYSDN